MSHVVNPSAVGGCCQVSSSNATTDIDGSPPITIHRCHVVGRFPHIVEQHAGGRDRGGHPASVTREGESTFAAEADSIRQETGFVYVGYLMRRLFSFAPRSLVIH